ncbi:MAG: DUF3775 domain-containing protein [Gammaproteobacteria bacterium]
MLELNPEIVCFIIDKAHEFHAKEQVVIPEEPINPSDDWALQVLADHEDDPTYLELKTTIDDLEPDQQEALVALMWLGRGDYEVDEWEAALRTAHESHNERTAEYLIATPLLADYLAEGLSLLGYSCEE